jgi:hypothetical protein
MFLDKGFRRAPNWWRRHGEKDSCSCLSTCGAWKWGDTRFQCSPWVNVDQVLLLSLCQTITKFWKHYLMLDINHVTSVSSLCVTGCSSVCSWDTSVVILRCILLATVPKDFFFVEVAIGACVIW